MSDERTPDRSADAGSSPRRSAPGLPSRWRSPRLASPAAGLDRHLALAPGDHHRDVARSSASPPASSTDLPAERRLRPGGTGAPPRGAARSPAESLRHGPGTPESHEQRAELLVPRVSGAGGDPRDPRWLAARRACWAFACAVSLTVAALGGYNQPRWLERLLAALVQPGDPRLHSGDRFRILGHILLLHRPVAEPACVARLSSTGAAAGVTSRP